MMTMNKRVLNREALDVIMAVQSFQTFTVNDRLIYPARRGDVRELCREYYFAIPDAVMTLAGLSKSEHDLKNLFRFRVAREMTAARPQDLSQFPLWESESESEEGSDARSN